MYAGVYVAASVQTTKLQDLSCIVLYAMCRAQGMGMDAEVYSRLQQFFAPYNERLYALIGRDLGWENSVYTPTT